MVPGEATQRTSPAADVRLLPSLGVEGVIASADIPESPVGGPPQPSVDLGKSVIHFTVNGTVAFLEHRLIKTLGTFASVRSPTQPQPPPLLPVSLLVPLGAFLICSQATADNKLYQLVTFRVHAL